MKSLPRMKPYILEPSHSHWITLPLQSTHSHLDKTGRCDNNGFVDHRVSYTRKKTTMSAWIRTKFQVSCHLAWHGQSPSQLVTVTTIESVGLVRVTIIKSVAKGRSPLLNQLVRVITKPGSAVYQFCVTAWIHVMMWKGKFVAYIHFHQTIRSPIRMHLHGMRAAFSFRIATLL